MKNLIIIVLLLIGKIGFTQFLIDPELLKDPKKNGPKINEIIPFIEVFEYSKNCQQCFLIENDFRKATLQNVDQVKWNKISDTVEVTGIDIVYSKYPVRNGNYNEIYPLLFSRLENLFNLDETWNDANIQFRRILQTHCENNKQVDGLYHGIVVHYKLDTDEKSQNVNISAPENKLERIEAKTEDLISDQFTFEEIKNTIEHISSQLITDPVEANRFSTLSTDEQLIILRKKLTERINNYQSKPLEQRSKDELESFEKSISTFSFRFGNTDSTVYKVLNRHPEWESILVINDWTGSMYGHGSKVLDWHLKNLEKSGIISITLFNDGDNRAQSDKKIGDTHGIYSGYADDVDLLIDLFQYVMLKGGGGDGPENDIEGILKAIDENEFFKEVVLIADNNACVRDIELAEMIGHPVRIILCGYDEDQGVHPHYAYLAQVTGGGIYTIENDFEKIEVSLDSKEGLMEVKDKLFTIKKDRCLDIGSFSTEAIVQNMGYARKHPKKTTDLNGSSMHLLKVPNKIYRMKNLRKLNLSENELTELSHKIENLEKLRTLDISKNKFAKLPNELMNNRVLEYLNLSFNSFDSVPPQIQLLVHLKKLDLSHNQIENLVIPTLPQLKELNLSNNSIRSIPKNLFKFKKLEKLNLSNNAINVLPKSALSIRKINILDLSDNQLVTLPADISRWVRLKELKLTNNLLSEEEKARIKNALPYTKITF